MPPDIQKLYRVAVCKTQETADDFIVAFLFFERYYLIEGQEDGFFFDNYVQDADFHLAGLRDFHDYDFNVVAAPRGFAKSVKWGLQLPLLLLLTRNYYKIAICLATDDMVSERFSVIKKQISENERILEDFGDQRSTRGEGLWSNHNLELRNGSRLRGFSVTGRKRGGRPHLFILDDPEYDPDKSTDVAQLSAQFDRVIVKQIIPMLRPGCKLFWLGTTINRRCLLYHALTSDDPRYKFWNRRRLKSFDVGPDGSIRLLWPQMWSYEALMVQRGRMGPSAFAAEYQNEPVADEDRIFSIHPEYDTYVIDGPLTPSPYENRATIRFTKIPRAHGGPSGTGPEVVEMPMSEFMKKLTYMIMTFDYASTVSPTADYSTIAILGFSSDLTLWVLDFWAGKVTDNTLVNLMWKMGSRWRPRLICGDTANKSIMELLRFRVADFFAAGGDTGWRPHTMDIGNSGRGSPSKASRIKASEWRFTGHRIKFPLYLRNTGQWPMLFQQVEDFTDDLNLLEHDDAIDVVLGMAQFVVRPRGEDPGKQTLTPEDYLKKKQLVDDIGMPLYAQPEDAPPGYIDKAIDILTGRGDNAAGKNRIHSTPRVVR
jgi:hypothetical protein